LGGKYCRCATAHVRPHLRNAVERPALTRRTPLPARIGVPEPRAAGGERQAGSAFSCFRLFSDGRHRRWLARRLQDRARSRGCRILELEIFPSFYGELTVVIVGPGPAIDGDFSARTCVLFHRRFPPSSSASRFTAGASGFFTLIQSGHLVGPGRHFLPSRFDTMPSRRKSNGRKNCAATTNVPHHAERSSFSLATRSCPSFKCLI
jgi:hypothetical protein